MIVKICGITELEDAHAAIEAGADMLGFNFYPKSKRYLEPEKAREMCETLRQLYGEKCPLFVGVFVNEIVSNMQSLKNSVGFDAIQLSGDESISVIAELHGMAFKAIRPSTGKQAIEDVRYFLIYFPDDERLPSLLLDAYHPGEYGGTGLQTADDITQTVKARVPRLMLAGGLTPENVGTRVAAVQPWGVDVASGVEGDTPGIKDHAKMRAFIKAAREAAKEEERFDIYDENMTHLGIKPRSAVHRDGDWHQSFHLWVIYRDADGHDWMLVQKRAADKDTYPNLFDISAAGHLSAGEILERAAIREVEEELGINVTFEDLISLGLRLSAKKPSAYQTDREINHVFFLVHDKPLTGYHPNEEVAGLAMFSVDDGLAMCAGEREGVEAWYLATGTTTVSSINLTLNDFVPTNDSYLYKTLILAKRCLNGEKHLVI
jgi:phosphoribosylanthranilate isomerase